MYVLYGKLEGRGRRANPAPPPPSCRCPIFVPCDVIT